jgi:hypothetical protein
MSDQASSVANCGICLVCVKDSYSRDASKTKQPHAEKNLLLVPPNTVPGKNKGQSKAQNTLRKRRTVEERRKQIGSARSK